MHNLSYYTSKVITEVANSHGFFIVSTQEVVLCEILQDGGLTLDDFRHVFPNDLHHSKIDIVGEPKNSLAKEKYRLVKHDRPLAFTHNYGVSIMDPAPLSVTVPIILNQARNMGCKSKQAEVGTLVTSLVSGGKFKMELAEIEY